LLPGEENPTPLVRLMKVVPYRHTRVYAKLGVNRRADAVERARGLALLAPSALARR